MKSRAAVAWAANTPLTIETKLAPTKRKKAFLALGAAVAVIAGGYLLLADGDHVETDNAYVNADVAQITPLLAAPVAAVAVNNTQLVKRGDILVRLDDTDARIALARFAAENLLSETAALKDRVMNGADSLAAARAALA